MKEGKEARQHNYKVILHEQLNDVLLIHGFGPDTNLVPVVKEIIVDSNCGAAILRGADIFAPGVMAAHPGEYVYVIPQDIFSVSAPIIL